MKQVIINLFWLCLFFISFIACSEDYTSTSSNKKVIYKKIAVIMPSSEQTRWNRIVAWALDYVNSSQNTLSKQVHIDAEWINEDDDNWITKLESVVENDEYNAIIGPKNSTNAQKAALLCKKNEKTLILPIATSTELQRLYAGSNYVWNLTQSDITQCELLLAEAKLAETDNVSLLTSDDNYGKSFTDWFGFLATQEGLKVDNIVTYKSEEDVTEFLRYLNQQSSNYIQALIFAPSSERYALAFDEELCKLKAAATKYFDFPMILCSDVMNNSSILSKMKFDQYEGISPSAAPESGFNTMYEAKFGEKPISGEAHLFDAVLLSAYAIIHQSTNQTKSLNESLKAVVDGRESWSGSWLKNDIQYAFMQIQQGKNIDLSGVTGDWTFDELTHASVLNTTYSHWIYKKGQMQTLEYLSSDGGMHTTSNRQAWQWQSTQNYYFNQDQKEFSYPSLNERWAIVIGGSDDWVNYRHQADALAMYQLLRRHGYDDDHIILIMEDNLAYNVNNIHQGVIKVKPNGENLYINVNVDYKLSEISPDDLKYILLGQVSEHLPKVITSKAEDNIMFFWCGHGSKGSLAWGSNYNVTASTIYDILNTMYKEQKYRKLFFALDACYSGSIGEVCKGLPGVIVTTAANSDEPSKADMKDEVMGIWLSNGFTRSFQEAIDNNTNISLRDLYYVVSRQTFGSHAMMYNVENYGNAYNNSMAEYLN